MLISDTLELLGRKNPRIRPPRHHTVKLHFSDRSDGKHSWISVLLLFFCFHETNCISDKYIYHVRPRWLYMYQYLRFLNQPLSRSSCNTESVPPNTLETGGNAEGKSNSTSKSRVSRFGSSYRLNLLQVTRAAGVESEIIPV